MARPASHLQFLGRNRRDRSEPLLQLVMLYQARLLPYDAAAQEDHKIGYTPNIKPRGNSTMFFRVDFQHDGFAGQVGSGAGDFRSSHATRTAPIRPEVHEHGDRDMVNDFIE